MYLCTVNLIINQLILLYGYMYIIYHNDNTWYMNGYAFFPKGTPTSNVIRPFLCEDLDGDGYFNWGVGSPHIDGFTVNFDFLQPYPGSKIVLNNGAIISKPFATPLGVEFVINDGSIE